MYAKFSHPIWGDKDTTIYGYNTPGTNEVIEMFATHPYGAGASEAMRGKLHQYVTPIRISQAEFNAAYLNCSEEEMDEEDKTLSLGELASKYDDEA